MSVPGGGGVYPEMEEAGQPNSGARIAVSTGAWHTSGGAHTQDPTKVASCEEPGGTVCFAL